MLGQHQWALRSTRALRQLFWFILAHVVTLALASVAPLAEMGCTPAVPLRWIATVSALVLDKFGSVIFAALDAVLGAGTGASTAYQLFRLELLVFLLCANTVLFTTKIRFITLETLVVSQLEHGPLLQVIVEFVIGICKTWIFIQSLKLDPLERLLLDILLKL